MAARLLSPGGMGERMGKVNVRELTGLDKDNSVSKANAMCASKANQGIHLLLPSADRCSAISRRAGLITPNRFLEHKRHRSERPPLPPSLPQLSLLSVMPHAMGHPSGQLGFPVLAVSPPAPRAPPGAGRAARVAGKPVALCEHSSATTETSACYHCYFHKKHRPQHHTSLCEEN